MSLGYRILYQLGFTPWEQMASLPVGEQMKALFDREQEEREPPYGHALDVGCGSGAWAVELAKRGWRVTGIDNVPKALHRAAERANAAGVGVDLLAADVTTLARADIGRDFDLIIDIGCFHDVLSDEQRRAFGRGVRALANLGATMLVMAWQPGRRGPLPRGASQEEVEAAFPGWSLIDVEAMDVTGAPGYVRRAEPCFYRLRYQPI